MKSMVSSDKKLANAVGGKSTRACDNCIKKRARWYCAADDAFLCQSCDFTVHSVNPLAQRHQRVHLKTASIKSFYDQTLSENKPNITKLNPNGSKTFVPSWHKGFTRKARTPRNKKTNGPFFIKINNPFHLVPENYSKENSLDDNEEQLLYRVPSFDPFVSELCYSNEAINNMQNFGHESKNLSNDFSHEINELHDFLPYEMDTDVENLLGKGLEDESFDMESLGLLDTNDCSLGTDRVKSEDEGIGNQDIQGELIVMRRETFELNFDYDSPISSENEDIKTEIGEPIVMMMNNFKNRVDYDSKKKTFLRLDYEGVMSAWDGEKSLWTGERPELDSGHGICWPNCMGTCGTFNLYSDMGMIHGHSAALADRGREARVSRYREKRRTRLFSKKIRYEVRKLNAEKRPRMKGRFVKRANLVTPLLKK